MEQENPSAIEYQAAREVEYQVVQDEFVNIPVPRRFAMALYRRIGELYNLEKLPEQPAFDGDIAWWDTNRIQTLHDGMDNQVLRRLFYLLACFPNEWKSCTELALDLDCSPTMLAIHLAGLTRSIRASFGVKLWPIMRRKNPQEKLHSEYRMPQEIAVLWIEAMDKHTKSIEQA